ncbi:hypothetical protein HFN20_06350 [Paenibacillus dendritiformis]|uniref:hypothetical protein n=1 Tax=Paenibacillus dendritiformis TaxID=130049 RepID=UPI00143D7B47|nr:hypothetical protein [Paenibacillus dendritiformis]NKI20841.1 hypothetical protein [Paenibacillus dendritiformis]NRF98529.1 hypothetical protein [Paenibacillus dendritiformis]
MTQVQSEVISHERWGESLKLENGIYTVIVPLGFGIRIMHLSLKGGENVFFEDTEGAVQHQGEEFAALGGEGWKLRGGHRLWASPEAYPRTYVPDDKPIQYAVAGNGVKLLAPVEPWTQTAKEIELQFRDDRIEVIHRITNHGPWPIELAPWALSVMAPGGTAIVPHSRRETGFLPNRVFALWPYTKMNDERVDWGDDVIQVRQCADIERAFKFGTRNEEGWAAYAVNGTLFEKSYEPQQEAVYPDFGCSFELYTNDKIMELETLGPLAALPPGGQAVHKEIWKLAPCTDIEQYLATK